MTLATPGTMHGRADRWTLSAMRLEDLPQVLEIENASYPHPWSEALFRQELRIPFSRLVVARALRQAGTPVAGYLCRWAVADEIHILNVAVHPRHRRSGVGRLLMHEALREGRERNAVVVTLEVRRSNALARRLYTSLGFEEVGIRSDYYGRGEDALIMRLAMPHG
jgi:ribosomal-protein-alanine N-acetyltransferase